jgi:NTP pyrophosphatase (non-canonical NTP hydrolase)
MQNMDNGQPDETGLGWSAISATSASPSSCDDLAMLDQFDSAKDMIRAIFEASEAGDPLLGVQIQPDNKIMLATLVETAFVTQDDITDRLGVATDGRAFIGVLPSGMLDLPVEVAEVTGNIAESELAARYIEGKISAIDRALAMGDEPIHQRAVTWREAYEMQAVSFRETAREFRLGLHTPESMVKGRIERYNDDRSTGVSHANAITILVNDIHERNRLAGWWNDLTTGEPLDRNAGELIALCHSELSEALEGVRKNRMDDHLPHRKQEEVEMADCVIRIADYCGGRGLDLGGAIDEKLAYNAQRADHKPENRILDDGKKI